MRFLLARTLATLTAAGLATIRPPMLTEDERAAAHAIREDRMRADIRFLSCDLLEGRGPATRGGTLRDAEIVFVAYGIPAPEYQWTTTRAPTCAAARLQGRSATSLNRVPTLHEEEHGGLMKSRG